MLTFSVSLLWQYPVIYLFIVLAEEKYQVECCIFFFYMKSDKAHVISSYLFFFKYNNCLNRLTRIFNIMWSLISIIVNNLRKNWDIGTMITFQHHIFSVKILSILYIKYYNNILLYFTRYYFSLLFFCIIISLDGC